MAGWLIEVKLDSPSPKTWNAVWSSMMKLHLPETQTDPYIVCGWLHNALVLLTLTSSFLSLKHHLSSPISTRKSKRLLYSWDYSILEVCLWVLLFYLDELWLELITIITQAWSLHVPLLFEKKSPSNRADFIRRNMCPYFFWLPASFASNLLALWMFASFDWQKSISIWFDFEGRVALALKEILSIYLKRAEYLLISEERNLSEI